MDVSEVRNIKNQLEDEICKAVTEKTNKFISDTSVMIEGIYIVLTDLSGFSEENKKVLVSVQISLEL